ncbi:MAG: hypothetical protein Q8L14_09925, partial [Myxococcales bacterium]|nr:hypothetical protein [Myxococcales bacterium]
MYRMRRTVASRWCRVTKESVPPVTSSGSQPRYDDGVRRATLWLWLICACQAPPATQFEIVRPLALADCASEFAVLGAGTVLTVGRLETLTFPVRASLVCDGVPKMPEAFLVEAVDDQNLPVPLEVRVVAVAPTRFDVHVTFRTPDTSNVHFRLSVEPSIGQHQQSVAALRTETRSWTLMANALGNTGVIEGPGGRELFIDSRLVRVRLRTGDVWERSGIEGVAVTPNRVWLVGSNIESYRFDATGEGVLAGTWPLAYRPTAIAVRGEKVFIAGQLPSGVSFLQLEESGASAGPIRVVQPLVIGAARFISDDEVLLARGELLDVVRPASLDASVVLSTSQDVRSFPLSASVDGVWLGDDAFLSVVRPDGGVSRVAMANLAPQATRPSMRLDDVVPSWTFSSTISGARLMGVPFDASDGGLELRYVELPDGGVPLWASSRWLFARSQS